MEILIRWFALVFVQIIYFNIKIKKIDVGEIKNYTDFDPV